jgi:radical SAM superfamily enzyme YgiQ (UPF0313 family)
MEFHRAKNKIVLIQPNVGTLGKFSQQIPLSLLYVASGLVKNNFAVRLIDNRCCEKTWEKILVNALNEEVLFVGITVMGGTPISNAIEISRLVKSHSDIPIVWGGAQPSAIPAQILEKDFVDYTVSGSGVSSSIKLANILNNGHRRIEELREIPGLGYKSGGRIYLNEPYEGFEHVSYQDIPYSLIKDFSDYGQIGSTGRVFPIYSAYGCPYNCAFCISPARYRDFKKKWVALSAPEIADHIEFLIKNFMATEIYFYDDDSFVDLNHVRALLEEAKKRNLKIRMNFRGARINEVLKMDKTFLDELADRGTRILHIGLESGSQRILDLFKKGIRVEDILAANKKIAQSRIIAGYNWIIGTPTETREDIDKTAKLILKLIEENPRCFVFQPNKFQPFVGTELAQLAFAHGYKQPERLEDWIYPEIETDKPQPWYSKETHKMIKMLYITSFFIDGKSDLLLEKNTPKNLLIKLLSKLYKPIARIRFKYGITFCLFEHLLYKFFISKSQK